MHKPNNILESDVKDELGWDLRIDDSRIIVKAADGRVTLSGAVPTYDDLMLATEDARRVGGVTAVENELLVGRAAEAFADVDVAASCEAALARDQFVPKGAVSVAVTDGWVTLTGKVRHHYQRQAAKHAVRHVDGVAGVTDKIAITSEPIPSDVVDRIRLALQRAAIVDDSLIDVTNSGHTIYLDGTAGSWAARRAAEDAAWAAPGVHEVVDRVEITP